MMLVVSVLLLTAAPSAQAPIIPIYGVANVVDGDSLHLGETRIRLFGVDAPELAQTCSRAGANWQCGIEAMQKLKRLVMGKEVRCIPMGQDDFGRTLARCDTIGVDINQAMVESGFATAFRKYAPDYVAAEQRAKAGRRGLWSGTFEQPSDYRARERRTATKVARSDPPRKPRAQAQRGTAGCVIKGNHSRRGEWIYHLPGMPYYDQTRAEDIFCSEAEAQAAGYRRARTR